MLIKSPKNILHLLPFWPEQYLCWSYLIVFCLSTLPSPEWVNLVQYPGKNRSAHDKHFSHSWESLKATPALSNITIVRWGGHMLYWRMFTQQPAGVCRERIRTQNLQSQLLNAMLHKISVWGVMINPSIHLTFLRVKKYMFSIMRHLNGLSGWWWIWCIHKRCKESGISVLYRKNFLMLFTKQQK